MSVSALSLVLLISFVFRHGNTTASPDQYQCCSGLSVDLLKMLGEKISFDFELFEVPDRKWGAYDRVSCSTKCVVVDQNCPHSRSRRPLFDL